MLSQLHGAQQNQQQGEGSLVAPTVAPACIILPHACCGCAVVSPALRA